MDGDGVPFGRACSGGVCVGTPKNCDDGDLCINDHCNVLSGDCYQTQVNCGDGVSCTTDCCDPEIGCQHYPSSQPCSVQHFEDAAGCPGSDVTVTVDVCNEGLCDKTFNWSMT